MCGFRVFILLEASGSFRAILLGMNGAELRRRREALGLTQSQLGARLGISLRTVQEWESDFRPIRPMVELAIEALEDRAARGIE